MKFTPRISDRIIWLFILGSVCIVVLCAYGIVTLENMVYADEPSFVIPWTNQHDAMILYTPRDTHTSVPMGAIHILTNGTDNAFESGIIVETKGNSVDMGRGIMVLNWGKSDGVYLQQEKDYGTGLAVLNKAAHQTGIVYENRGVGNVGMLFLEGPNGGSTTQQRFIADKNGTAVMSQYISLVPNKYGITMDMVNGDLPLIIKNNGATKFRINIDGSIHMSSPNGTLWNIKINNNGQLITSR